MQAETFDFLMRRLQGLLLEMGFAHDVVEAVLSVRAANPSAARRACLHLGALVAESWWKDAFTAYARTARITRNLTESYALNPGAYQEVVEQPLHDAYAVAAAALAAESEPAALLGEQLRGLEGPINAYFENVLVNAEDGQLRQARVALAQQIAALPQQVADLSKLQGF